MSRGRQVKEEGVSDWQPGKSADRPVTAIMTKEESNDPYNMPERPPAHSLVMITRTGMSERPHHAQNNAVSRGVAC